MAKGKAKKGGKGKKVDEGETIVVTHHVKEWQPHSHDPLPMIEATIDSWGRGGNNEVGLASSALTSSARDLDHEEVAAHVDKITKRVKGTRKVVVTETVTEWVEGPMGSGPTAVEDEAPQDTKDTGGDAGWAAKQFAPSDRPKRRFSLFGRKDKKDTAEGKGAKDATNGQAAEKGEKADKDYQPQCMALTEDGAQCRNSARGDSKYCISHFGYQPPTAKGLAQRIEGDAWDPDDHVTDHDSVRSKDTQPKVAKAKDTKLRTRKASKGGKKKRYHDRKLI